MASRSLGQLTIDLVARTGGFVQGMTKAERESKKWRRQVQKDLQAVGKAAGIASAAVVGGLTAIVASSIKNADQSRKTAQAVGLTTEAYTGLTFAASQSGVATGELNAGLGRLNRSILEASQGTAQYADSFAMLGVEVVDAAGNIRQTEAVLADIADRFATLPDGVEKSALAMELLGRSGAKLIPLLNGGADGINALTAQAEALGLVISNETAKQAELFNDSLAIMSGVAKGVGNQLAAELLPTLSGLAAGFADVAIEGQVVPAIAEKISNSLKAVTRVAVSAGAAFDIAGKTLGGLGAIVASIPRGFQAVADTFKVVRSDISDTALEYANLLDVISGAGAGGGEAAQDRVRQLADMMSAIRAQGVEQQRAGLEEQEALVRESYERRRQMILDNTQSTGQAQRDLLVALEKQTNEEISEVNQTFWQRYLESTEENLLSLNDLTANLLNNVSTQFGDALESIVFDFESVEDAAKGVFESILRTVVNALGQMAAQWLAYQAVQLVIGKTSEAAAVTSAAATGTAIASAYAPAAAAASLASFGSNAAPAIAGIVATNAVAESLALSGMAHDGIDSVPKTGTWLLEKGERVMTSETSAKLDKKLSELGNGGSGVVVNINQDARRAGEVQQNQTADGRTQIDVFVADIYSDGPQSRAIQNAFGLRRVGR